jgi:hypothetical protein
MEEEAAAARGVEEEVEGEEAEEAEACSSTQPWQILLIRLPRSGGQGRGGVWEEGLVVVVVLVLLV